MQNQKICILLLPYENTKEKKKATKSEAGKHPAVLVEIGYLSNAEECKQLTSDAYQKKMGNSLGEAINQTILTMQNKEK